MWGLFAIFPKDSQKLALARNRDMSGWFNQFIHYKLFLKLFFGDVKKITNDIGEILQTNKYFFKKIKLGVESWGQVGKNESWKKGGQGRQTLYKKEGLRQLVVMGFPCNVRKDNVFAWLRNYVSQRWRLEQATAPEEHLARKSKEAKKSKAGGSYGRDQNKKQNWR